MDVGTKSFGDLLQGFASFVGQLSAFRFGTCHQAIDDVADTCGESSGVLFGCIAPAQRRKGVAACFVSFGPIMFSLLAFEGGLEVLKSGLHDFDRSGFWTAENKKAVVICDKKNAKYFLITGLRCPQGGRDCESENVFVQREEDAFNAEAEPGDKRVGKA